MEFVEKLLDFRARYNLTQKQMAEILGVNPMCVHRWECKKYKPTKKNEIMFSHKTREWELKHNE